MSNALAIAAVTAVLRDLLNDGLINWNLSAAFDFEVTVQPPDLLSASTPQPTNRLNLYLFRTTPNPGWTNMHYPSRDSSGERISNPYLALDLHYILSAHSTENFNAEVLLGFGMQTLHEMPVLDRADVRNSLSAPDSANAGILPPGFQQLAAADLADQIEQIKISPQNLSLEEVSQLWTAVNAPMRMSAIYLASVVLIESRASTRSALPVRQRSLYVRQMQRPRIHRLLSRANPADPPALNRPIVHGDQLIAEGSGLRGESTTVRVGEAESAPVAEESTDRRITTAVPAALHPGVHGVQVVHRIPKDPPSTGEMDWEVSNLMPFVLGPSIASTDPLQLLSNTLVDNAQPAGPVEGSLQVVLDHNIGTDQQISLLLREFQPPSSRRAYAYSFDPEPFPENLDEVNQFTVSFTGVRQAVYLVRVRVDGAETQLGFDGTEYNNPQLDLTLP